MHFRKQCKEDSVCYPKARTVRECSATLSHCFFVCAQCNFVGRRTTPASKTALAFWRDRVSWKLPFLTSQSYGLGGIYSRWIICSCICLTKIHSLVIYFNFDWFVYQRIGFGENVVQWRKKFVDGQSLGNKSLFIFCYQLNLMQILYYQNLEIVAEWDSEH